MRTTMDRIRHALAFESIGLLVYTPLASLVFGFEWQAMGVVVVTSSLVATVWNYFYNLMFDRVMDKRYGKVQKTIPIRVLHAILFEGGLLILFLPVIAWYLGITLWQALTMDVTMAIFYLTYAFIYNWIYDRMWPVIPKM